jgi:uncharacterized protein
VAVAWFRFYADLNDFLPSPGQGKQLSRHFDVIGPVKDLIESFGVPHTEVDLVLINGKSAAPCARRRRTRSVTMGSVASSI